MHSSTRVIVLAPAVLAAAAGLYLLGRLSAPTPSAARVGFAADGERTAESVPASTTERALAATDVAPGAKRGTLRALLEQYYGKPWSELEPELAQKGLDPDRMERLEPWETVAAEFRRQVVHDSPEDRAASVRFTLEWPDGKSLPDWYGGALNPDKKALAPVDVQNLEHLTAEYESRLSDLADAYCKLLPRCMADQWDRGLYTKTPLVETVESRAREGRALGEFRKLILSHGGGWRVSFDFESASYPELDQLSTEIRAVKAERVERVREYIAGL